MCWTVWTDDRREVLGGTGQGEWKSRREGKGQRRGENSGTEGTYDLRNDAQLPFCDAGTAWSSIGS